ncbi:hypothetical protein PV08_11032 [Exophiala spinifera]|uniref:Uncharacterized protein n=1 Tax=Exophiala spinifera TaxID=91928 RepID=A0A0D2AZ30_9EURO|nr:uncharacterized protein PV08_11032 [Exophiala spinifera]KIW11730.1 hypothetical protein PV08_11032 [Exophiala spinifera]
MESTLESPSRLPLLPEKSPTTPATSNDTDSLLRSPISPKAQKAFMKGAMTSLVWGACAPCIPIMIVTCMLLKPILSHRIKDSLVFVPTSDQATTGNEALDALKGIQSFQSSGGSKAYYLHHNEWTNPAVLHMIASWSAKILPFVTGTSMALVAFFAGHHFIWTTQNNSKKLPSPHQVSILIGLLNGGGTQPLIDTIKYRMHHDEHLVQPLPIAFWSLSFIVVMTFAIGAIDSWFGATTTALNIALVTPSANTSHSFGRSLISDCISESWQQHSCPSNAQATCAYPCSISTWNASSGQEREGVKNAQQAAQTLMFRSKNTTVLNTTLNGASYFFLGDVDGNAKLDFSATAVAVSTQCQMVTPNCTVRPDLGPGFTCGSYNAPSFSYSGAVGFAPSAVTSPSDMAMVGIQFFNDTEWNQPVGFGDNTTDLFAVKNPIYFLTWSKGFPPMNTHASDGFSAMRNGRYYQYDDTGDAVYILDCSTSIYDAEYYWVNGTVASIEIKALKSGYYGAALSAPFSTYTALAHLSLQDAAALAAYQTDPQNLTALYSSYFSRAAIGLTSGFSVAVANERESNRTNSYLATRVPLVPLYTLIALKAVYAAFALGLALLAVFLANPSQSQEAKERLTIHGLAAGFFEPKKQHERAVRNVQDLFEEHRDPEPSDDTKRIGMVRTQQGGWQWVTLARKTADTFGIPEMVNIAADEAAGRQDGIGRMAQGLRLVNEII